MYIIHRFYTHVCICLPNPPNSAQTLKNGIIKQLFSGHLKLVLAAL